MHDGPQISVLGETWRYSMKHESNRNRFTGKVKIRNNNQGKIRSKTLPARNWQPQQDPEGAPGPNT